MAFAGYLLAYVVVSASGLLLLRRSLAGASIADALADPRFYAGAVGYALSFGTFLLALRRYEVLTVYPAFVGAAYAAVVAGAAVFLGEQLTTARVAGIALVGGGLLLLTR